MSPHPERPRARTASIVRAGATLVAALVLAGCSDSPPTASPPPDPSGTPSSSSEAAPLQPTPSQSSAAEPALNPDGTADENLPVFSAVTAAVWATPEQVSGRAYIDALVGAGFDKAAMQVTHDETTVGNPAESIQFAVRWGEDCIVGQVGPATGAPVTAVVPALSEGGCLVGGTRPIDW